MDMLSYMYEQYPWLLYILGGLGIAVSAYGAWVKLTPSKEDDKKWEEIKGHKVWGPLIRLVSKKSPPKK